MRALSLVQPYATLIAIGAKRIETRSRLRPPEALIGQRIAIHASKGFADMTVEYFCYLCTTEPFKSALVAGFQAGLIKGQKEPEHLYPGDLPRGAILCTVRITGCWSTNNAELVARIPEMERAFGGYAPNRWMWGLADVQVFPEPIAASGKLGLWQWEPPEGALATLTPLACTTEREAVGA